MPEINKIAVIRTPFSTKFGIPRQSGLIDTAAEIIFEKEYRPAEAVRGLEGFSHIWLIWGFSLSPETTSLTVRPPRLGGNKRLGVFATRSPFRPNRLGLSCVRLEGIEFSARRGPVLRVRGADISDGSPVYDIKPYLPFTDAHPEASGGFAQNVFSDSCEVIFPNNIKDNIPAPVGEAIEKMLSSRPEPHYRLDEEKIYAFEFDGYKIKFRTNGRKAEVLSAEREKEK